MIHRIVLDVTDLSVQEVHGFEFPAKTIFANKLKTIDLKSVGPLKKVTSLKYSPLAKLSCTVKSLEDIIIFSLLKI